MANRQYAAPCECYELDLTCFHTLKERTKSLADSVILTENTAPGWMQHFALEVRSYRSVVGKVRTS